MLLSTPIATHAANLNHGWHSRNTGLVNGSDTTCGPNKVREEFIIRDVDTNATTTVGSALLRSSNQSTNVTVSSTVGTGGVLGPICYNPDTDKVEVDIDGGSAYYDFYSSMVWATPSTITRGKYVQSTVWVKQKKGVSTPSYNQSFPLWTQVKVNPVYQIALNALPTYYGATRVTRVQLFVVSYNTNTNALGPTVINTGIPYTGGVGTITLPSQSISEGYYKWAYYIILNGSHPDATGGTIIDTPESGLGWNDFSLFAYDRTAPAISGLAHTPSTPYPTDPVTITADATDAMIGIVSMKIYVDNALHTPCSFFYKNSATCSANAGTFVAGSTHTYFVVATDGLGNTATSSVQNFTVVDPKPDLNTTSVVIPATADTVSEITLSGTVANIGNAGTGAPFSTSFEMADSITGTNATSIGVYMMSALGSSTESTSGGVASVKYTFEASHASTTRYIRMCADRDSVGGGSIGEANEANNCSSWTSVTVAPQPDLMLKFGLSNGPYTHGVEIQLNGAVSGVASTATVPFANNFTYQWGTTTGVWNTIISFPHEPFAPGMIYYDVVGYVPEGQGTLYLQYCVDAVPAEGAISESDETNNCSILSISVDQPALNPPVLTATPGSCGVIALTWTDVFFPAAIPVDATYRLARDGADIYKGNSTWYTDIGLTPLSVYKYTITVERSGYISATYGIEPIIAPSGGCTQADISADSVAPFSGIVSNKIGVTFEGRVTNLSTIDVEEAGSAALQIDSNNDDVPDLTYDAHAPLVGQLGVTEGKDISYTLSNLSPGNYRYRFAVDVNGTLTESDEANNATEWVPFKVIGGTLSASSAEINVGSTTDITWSTQNAGGLACSVSGDSIPMNGQSGTVTTSALSSDTSFTLSCLDTKNSSVLLASVMVYVGTTPELTIRPRVVSSGESVTISWDTHNSDEQACELLSSPLASDLITENIDDPSRGSIELPITARMTYILTCPHASSVLYDMATVEIVPQGFEL